MGIASLIAGSLTKADITRLVPHDIASWKYEGQQQGSNPGGTFTDKLHQKWYVKFPQTDCEQARTEFLANRVYAALGIPVPEMQLVTGQAGWGEAGNLGVASQVIEGKPLSADDLPKSQDVLEGFVSDAYLANHDVIGSNYNNILAGPDGRDYRIDQGGALNFRAQGGDKDFSGSDVPQIDSMRDPGIAREAGTVFATLTDADLEPQVKHLVATLTDDKIRELVNEAGLPATYVRALIGRRDALARRFKVSKALAAWSALAKDWVTISGAHVFISDDGRITRGPKSMVGQVAKPDGTLVADKHTAALKNFKPATKAHQKLADANEQKVAEALGGLRTPDNSPLDILWPGTGKAKVGLEIKSLIGTDVTNVRVNMRPSCRDAKVDTLASMKLKGFVVLIDNRGGGEKIYAHAGMGAFRLNQMTPLKSLKQLKYFIAKAGS